MLLLKPKHLPNLPITQRQLSLIHLTHDRCIRTELLQKLLPRDPRRNRIIRRIENLEPNSSFCTQRSQICSESLA
jgi:hypothetical protein